MRPRLLGDERGSGLVLSMLTVIAFLIAAAGVVASMRALKKESIYQAELLRAQALAESGAENAILQLQADAGWRTGFSQKALGSGYYNVTVSTPARPTITATGYAPKIALLGRAFKTISFQVEVATITQMTNELLANHDLTIKNGAYVDSYNSETSTAPSSFGSASRVQANNKVTLSGGGNQVFGDLYYVSGTNPGAGHVSGTISTNSGYTFPSVGGSTYSSDSNNDNQTGLSPTSVYNSGTQDVSIGSGVTATITTGIYYFHDLTVSGTLNVSISNGPVVIYLEHDANFTGAIVNPTGVPGNFIVYGKGGGHNLTINATQAVYGVFIGSDFTANVQSTVYGAIGGNDVTLDGGILHADLSLQRATVNAVYMMPNTWQSLSKRY